MGPLTLHSERKKIDRYTLWTLGILVVATILFISFEYREERDAVRIVAREIANTAYEKDVAYRRWNAMHGGVYVPVTEKTPPNPWLEVPEREIVTPSGRLLTKMNPAYMTRQVYDMMLAEHPDALVGHITSLRPIRPENAPLPWEVEALKSFEQGEREFSRIETVDGKTYFRFMRPFVTEKPCLTCHARQGYREGEIRGGIGITVPIDPILSSSRRHVLLYATTAFFLLLAGVSITLIFRKRFHEALDDSEKAWNRAISSESTYRVLFEESQAVMLLVDPDTGRIFRANPAACRFYGYSEEEFSALTIFDVNTADPDETRRLMDRVRDKEVGTFIARHRLKGGEVRTVEVISTPVEIDGCTILHSIVTDVTERIEAQRRAEENLSFAWSLVSHSTVPTFVIDPSHRVMVWNHGMEELTGIAAKDLIGTDEHWRGFYGAPAPCLADLVIEKCSRGETCSHLTQEIELMAGGRSRNLSLSAAPVFGEEGELLAVIQTVFDLTDRETLRDQLVTTQKMESLGLLSSGIAHDFNNILTVISGYATMLSLTLTDADKKHHAEEILAAVERASSLTRTILAFSGRHHGELRSIDLVPVIRGMQKMLRRLVPESIALSMECPDCPIRVRADQTQIEQVVMNLVVNARDAVGEKGTIQISLSQEPDVSGSQGADPSGGAVRHAMLTVQDDGPGVPPELMDQIFTPFFTTKGDRGTGLGLFIVREIAERHGGTVRLESEPGKGSRFTLLIPLIEHIEEQMPIRRLEAVNYHGAGSVLVLDDEASIREMISSCLRRYGYDPVEAIDARDALRLVLSGPEKFVAIISDLVMPGMTGVEFLREIRNHSIQIPFVIISGYPDKFRSTQEFSELGATFLMKPFTPLQLLAILKDVVLLPRSAVS